MCPDGPLGTCSDEDGLLREDVHAGQPSVLFDLDFHLPAKKGLEEGLDR